MDGRLKHEVALSERVENQNTYKEILAHLRDGKVYEGDPSKQLPQAAQKGSVCWYYALNRIRIRYGSEYRSNANRHVEKIISKYRKHLTKMEAFRELMDLALTNAPSVLGIKTEAIKLGKLRDCLIAPAASSDVQSHTDNLQFHLQMSQWIKKNLVKTSEDEGATLSETLLPFFIKGLPDEENLKNKLAAVSPKINYLERLVRFHKMFNDIAKDEDVILTALRARLSIFTLTLVDYYIDILQKNVDALSAQEVTSYIHSKLKVDALYDLYKNLHLKADYQFLKKTLTAGVYNSGMIQLAEATATHVTNALNKGMMPDASNYIFPHHLVGLESLYTFGQAQAFAHIVGLYDLEQSTWTPKQGFQGLMEAINCQGALVMGGLGIGKGAYTSSPQMLKEKREAKDENEEKEAPVKIGSRSILFWPTKSDLKPMESSRAGHAIVVLGVQSVETANHALQEYVFFLDPNDASIPGQERTVYRMDYCDFSARVMMHNGIRITDANHCPADSCYAIAARRPR